MNPKSLTLHPDAHLVPDMRPDEYAALRTDIREHGVKVSLEVQGTILLDGRHRLKAALELGLPDVPVMSARLNGDEPTAYLLKAAILRRHLTDDQRAIMAAMTARAHPRSRPGVPHPTGVGNSGKTAKHPALADAARHMNVSISKAIKAAEVLRAAPELAAKAHTGEIPLREAQRRLILAQGRQAPPLPTGKFRVIYADPPWEYEQFNSFREGAGTKYPTMSREEISALRVPDVAADDSVLFLWVTGPLLLQNAPAVLEGWGFTYKQIMVWRKNRAPGIGWWVKGLHEYLVIATRGAPGTPPRWQDPLIEAPVIRHSEKPARVYDMIEAMFPGPYLELFARTVRPGWTAWGNEVPGEPGPAIDTAQA